MKIISHSIISPYYVKLETKMTSINHDVTDSDRTAGNNNVNYKSWVKVEI